ncbi:MAG: LOG family protein [Paludisphaera borealis]|uniref:LOG family protein n=1 Tax=Paludisphaera borealis TaxID=1387353 RepID=UPI00283EB175|nr:LOG family protein [Paludisphaera borealis]MDR3622335.1 LOG family protein [Paludisphaera borealis]
MSEQADITGSSDVVRLGDEGAAIQVVAQAILGLWEVVNNLTRLRPTWRERYRVTIFGSARTDSDHWVYDAVRDLAADLTRQGCDIVTGGGPGLMQAANEGARMAGADLDRASVGIRVDLPFEQDVNPFVTQMFDHRTFFSRLHHFVLVSDAFVVVPGGIGTVLETMMIWQLLQVQKLRDTPLILVGGMWSELVEWARTSMLRPDGPLASPEDFAIPICCQSGPEVIAILREHHNRWNANQEAAP